MSGLPTASPAQVRAHAQRLALRHRRALAAVLALHGLAAAAGLAAPWLLGDLVQDVGRGSVEIDRTALLICVSVIAQALLVRFAVDAAGRLGEEVLAEVREEFVGDVAALPLSTVEQAGTGDLVTRSSRDVDQLSETVRQAVPEMAIASARIAFAIGAVAVVGPLLAVPCLIGAPIFVAGARWWFPRAREAYLRVSESFARLTGGLAETVDGARTVEALRIGGRRLARAEEDIATADAAERRALRLSMTFVPITDATHFLPVAATLLAGGLLYAGDHVSLAAATAAVLYALQLQEPTDVLLFRTTGLQSSAASAARLLGVQPQASRPAGEDPPPLGADQLLVVRGVRHAYRAGRDVLHDVDLVVEPGERLAVVGPSGAGKSTLGRLLAGIHAPTAGSIALGDVPLGKIPPERLRREVALITQEHHVFRASLRDNLAMAKDGAGDDELRAALTAVDAWEWARELGLDMPVGSGGHDLTASQAQQLALARIVLADPRILILDEATSLLSPHVARHMERSLAAVLEGRTVIAIAHRLHTAYDADRIVVMERGRIVEVGPHDVLMERGGSYAALWRSWHGDGAAAPSHDPAAPRTAR